MHGKAIKDFDSYYRYYLSKHKTLGCKIMHLIGCIFTIVWLLYAIYSSSIFMLLTTPFVVYPFAWIGHWVFEKNRPAVISGDYSFIWAKMSDFKMCYELLTGKLPKD